MGRQSHVYSESCATATVSGTYSLIADLLLGGNCHECQLGKKGPQVNGWRLEKAYRGHSSVLEYLKVVDSFEPLRSDPRCITLLQRVGLPR